MYFTSTSKTPPQRTPSGNALWRLLPEEIGVPTSVLRYFEVAVGGHTSYGKHPWEHEVYVVRGKGLVRGKDLQGREVEQRVQPGDAVYIAPNEEHQFVNQGDMPFGFVCVVPKGCE